MSYFWKKYYILIWNSIFPLPNSKGLGWCSNKKYYSPQWSNVVALIIITIIINKQKIRLHFSINKTIMFFSYDKTIMFIQEFKKKHQSMMQ